MRDGLGKSASMDRGFRKWTKGWNLRMSGLQLIGEVCSLVEQGSGAELVFGDGRPAAQEGVVVVCIGIGSCRGSHAGDCGSPCYKMIHAFSRWNYDDALMDAVVRRASPPGSFGGFYLTPNGDNVYLHCSGHLQTSIILCRGNTKGG